MLPGPVMALILSFTTFTLILGLTSSQSLLRPAFLPLMLIYIYVGSFHYPFVHPLYASLIGGSVFGGALHYIDHVLLSRWTFSARGPTSALGGQLPVISSSKGNSSGDGTIGSAKLRSRALSSSASPASSESSESSAPCTPSSGALSTIASRLWWAASHFFECRFNNTPWEVANVPPFSRRDAAAVPSRISFVSYSTAVSVVCILLVDAARLLNGPPEVNAVLFAEDRVKLLMRLGDVTTEEMVLRFMSAILYWTVAYFLIQGVYSGVAAVMVGLWLSDVQRWKPLFGRLTDAWSVRQFWGAFWHQGLRQILSSPARFTTYTILGLRKGGLLGRYTFIFLTFLLSGLLHICSDLTAGHSWRVSGGMRFFCVQTLGIMLEDAVQAAYRALQRFTAKGPKRNEVSSLERAVGYLWVLVWMMWSVPAYAYPSARRNKGEGVLPFSLLEGILLSGDQNSGSQ